jgi:hypothetical protein
VLGIAALRAHRGGLEQRRVAVVITGRNMDRSAQGRILGSKHRYPCAITHAFRPAHQPSLRRNVSSCTARATQERRVMRQMSSTTDRPGSDAPGGVSQRHALACSDDRQDQIVRTRITISAGPRAGRRSCPVPVRHRTWTG